MSDRDAERSMAEELYAHRDDPEEWGEEEAVEVHPSRGAVVCCRLSVDELDIITHRARVAGETLSGLVRRALLYGAMSASQEPGNEAPALYTTETRYIEGPPTGVQLPAPRS